MRPLEVPSDIEEAAFSARVLQSDEGKTAEKKDPEKGEKRSKRRRLKNLPTFASADDYAKMLGDEDEDEDEGQYD